MSKIIVIKKKLKYKSSSKKLNIKPYTNTTMFKKVSRTPHTYSNGKTIIFEEIFYEFCPDLWGEIKSFLLPPKVCPCCNKKAKVKKIPFKSKCPYDKYTTAYMCQDCLENNHRGHYTKNYFGWADFQTSIYKKATKLTKKLYWQYPQTQQQQVDILAAHYLIKSVTSPCVGSKLFELYDSFGEDYVKKKPLCLSKL